MNTDKNEYLWFFFSNPNSQVFTPRPLSRGLKNDCINFFHSFVTVVETFLYLLVEMNFLMFFFWKRGVISSNMGHWDIYAKFRKEMADCLQPILSRTLNHTHVLQLGRNPNHIHIQIGRVCLVDNQQNRAFHLMAISKIHRHTYYIM